MRDWEYPPVNITGWMADFSGCGFYRIAMPGTELSRRGHHVTVSNDIRDTTTLTDVVNAARDAFSHQRQLSPVKNVDVIVGQRINMPAPSQVWQEIARNRIRPKLVFEIDDDLFNIPPHNPRAHQYFMQPAVRRRMLDNARVADVITVSTWRLKQRMMALTGKTNVRVIPNTVPGWLTRYVRPSNPDLITVGWAGSTTHEIDWKVAAGPVGKFVCSRPDVEFHMIGAQYPLAVPLGQYRHSIWRNTVPAYWRSIDFDIGLAPLADHVFNDSKSHIKALEYAALGIPVIASNVGPYKQFVKHGVTGFLVSNDSPHLWQHYLDVLARDPALRATMGEQARKLAQNFLIENWGPVWEIALS